MSAATPWGVVWQASDGSDDQPEEVVGGLCRFAGVRDHRNDHHRDFPGRQNAVDCALLGVLFVLTTALGDLVESQVKRDLGIKDMGRLLPGHGGLMDRLDGILPSAVAAWIVLTLLP